MGALSIDDNLAEAHLSLALITLFFDWDWPRSEDEFRRAISLDPNNAEALSFYAIFLGTEERFDEAIEYGERSLEIDPLSPLINMNVGWTYFSAGVFDKAFERIDKMIEVEPEFYGAHWLAGAIHLTEGKYDDAVGALEKAVANGGRQIVLSDLGSAYGLAGRKDKAKEILDQLLENREREYAPAFCIARVYCRLGETEKAIDWFEKAFEERNGEMVFLKGEIEGAADDDPLKLLGDDQRIVSMLNRVQASGRN
jgi:tetratricopeptide (TPR) repeat protein